MKPTIDFHGIASMRLTDIGTITRDDGSRFSYRNLELTDAKGDTFRVGLFADTAYALFIREPRVSEPLPVCACDGIPPAIDQVTGKEMPW